MRRMKDRKNQAAAIAVCIGLAGLALCALVVSPEPPEDRLAPRILAFLQSLAPGMSSAATVVLAFGFGMGAFLIVLGTALKILDRKAGRREAPRRARRPERGIVAGLLILIATFVLVPRLSMEAFKAILARDGTEETEAAGQPSGYAVLRENAARHEEAEGRMETPQVSPLLAMAAALAGALALACGLAIILWRRDRTAAAKPDADILAALAAADVAGRARRRIELGDPVGDAVVECYAAMCDIFEERAREGGRNVGALTAREFAERLAALGAGEPEIRELTSVFEKARYSGEACDEADGARAAKALGAIEARYAALSPGRRDAAAGGSA